MTDLACPFVSRAGMKLAAALDAFGLQVAGWTCADFGCNVGGFTDCLLQRGAARVYAVDTGYGALAWKLRRDQRVVTMERTNVLYVAPAARVDLVVADVGWTPQRFFLPAAGGWLKSGGQVVSLLKPHYERSAAGRAGERRRTVLTPQEAQAQCLATLEELDRLGWRVRALAVSPLLGAGGNTEFLLWAESAR